MGQRFLRGSENLILFNKLMKLVIKKSEINKPFLEFSGQQFELLSKKIALYYNKMPDIERPIAKNTFRDYRFMCDPNNLKYTFSISQNKLDLLCRYVDENTWKDFAENRSIYNRKDGQLSFYTTNNIFNLIHDEPLAVNTIMSQNPKFKIDNTKNSIQLLFDHGVCNLYNKSFRKAFTLFDSCCHLDSYNAKHYFFKSLCMLENKRPSRHRKTEIDNILKTLNFAIKFDPTNTVYEDFLIVIYKDFHEQLGYSYDFPKNRKVSIQENWIRFLEHCTDIPYRELVQILTY